MTFNDINNLEKNSTHKTIGSVLLYLDNNTKKCTQVKVTYKSGRTFSYRRKEDLPMTVKKFLMHQNYHHAFCFGKRGVTWCYYFMV